MPPVSPFALTLFLALVVILALAFVLAVRSARPATEPAATTMRWMWLASALVVGWLGISALLAQMGLLRQFTTMPPPFLLLVMLLTLATAVVAFSPLGMRLVNGISIGWLVGFQAFRVPLEWLLHRLYQEGVVPVQMTYAGRNFDLVSGLLALVIWGWAKVASPPRWAIWGFNLIGLALLINIIAIAVLSAPTPFRQFFNEPANTFIAYVPFVWLPAFLVQAAWFGHFLVFRWLRHHKKLACSTADSQA